MCLVVLLDCCLTCCHLLLQTYFQLELYLVQAVKDEILSARLCHRTQSVHFGVNLFQHKVSSRRSGVRIPLPCHNFHFLLNFLNSSSPPP